VGELRRRAVLVPQRPVLLAGPGTVREELVRPLEWAGRAADDAALRAALARLRLDALDLDAPADELSGGQQARLGLGRALLLEPALLLLDEATGSLDVRTAREVLAGLAAWAEDRDAAVLLVSHRPEDARRLGGRAAVLLDGRLRGPWSAEAVAADDVDDAEVRAFLGRLEPRAGGAAS